LLRRRHEIMAKSVFISYSHEDSELVEPFVTFIRGTADLVFHDATGIKPGKKWRKEIDKAIHASDLVALFWCVHSSTSEEVKTEYEMAISAAKDVMPILLDSTPLPTDLSHYHWVDFRNLLGKGHAQPGRWKLPSVGAGIGAALIGIGDGVGSVAAALGLAIERGASKLLMLEFYRRGLLTEEPHEHLE
jgi:hypothetical protein